jgi:hypothetical protein
MTIPAESRVKRAVGHDPQERVLRDHVHTPPVPYGSTPTTRVGARACACQYGYVR